MLLKYHMKNQNIKSVFEQISTHIFTSTDTLDKDKQYVIQFIESKGIDGNDKTTIVKQVNAAHSKYKLQQYVCNSLLRFEGLSVNSYGDNSAQK